MRRAVLIAVVALLATVAVIASSMASGTYKVAVSRVDTNLYRIHETPYYFETFACFEFLYGEQVILDVMTRGNTSVGTMYVRTYTGTTDCMINRTYERVRLVRGSKGIDGYGQLVELNGLLQPAPLK